MNAFRWIWNLCRVCPVAPEATCNMWLGALERPVSAPLTFGHPTEPMEGPRQRRIKLLGGMQDNSFPNTGSLICPPGKSLILFTKRKQKNWGSGHTWDRQGHLQLPRQGPRSLRHLQAGIHLILLLLSRGSTSTHLHGLTRGTPGIPELVCVATTRVSCKG